MSRLPIARIAEINPRCPSGLPAETDRRVSFLPMAAVSENGSLGQVEERALGDVIKGYTYFQRGDVIVAKITPCMENGKAAHLDELPHPVGFGSTEFHVMRPLPGTDGRYLFYMVWNDLFRYVAARNMTGTAGQKRVPASFLERFEIPLPPLAQQRRIADILDKADAVRRKRAEAIGLEDDLVRAVFLDLFGDPVTNPRGWQWVPMETVVRQAQYGTAAKANEERRGIPIVRMNNLTYDGKLDLADMKWVELAEDEAPKYLVKRGDLLFNRTNSPELVGKTAVWDRDDGYALAGYLVRVRLNDLATPEYVSGFLNSDYGKRYLFAHAKPSNNMSNFSAGMFKRIPLPLAPVETQRRFSEAVAGLRQLRVRNRRGLDEADALFKSLVQRAFNGEL